MKVGICTIGKLENNYIREFVIYHKNLGFDGIIINDNNDIDGEKFTDVINDYVESGYVTIRNVRGLKKIQSTAYAETYNEFGDKFDYIAFIDIDEFFTISSNNIKEELNNNKYSDFDQIRVAIKTATDNDLIKVENNNYSVLERFKTFIDEKYCSSIIKTGIRGLNYINAHGAHNLKSCDVIGNKLIDGDRFCVISDSPNYEPMYIKHYSYKTIEEYLNKISRGYPDGQINLPSLDNFFKRNKKTKEKLDFLKTKGIFYE